MKEREMKKREKNEDIEHSIKWGNIKDLVLDERKNERTKFTNKRWYRKRMIKGRGKGDEEERDGRRIDIEDDNKWRKTLAINLPLDGRKKERKWWGSWERKMLKRKEESEKSEDVMLRLWEMMTDEERQWIRMS